MGLSSKLKNLCCFCMAMFSTMPIITIPFFNDLSLYTIFLILSLAIMTLQVFAENSGLIRIGKPTLYILMWLALALIGSVCGVIYFLFNGKLWLKNDISYIPKIVLYIIFIFLWSTTSNKDDEKAVIKGLLVGALANVVWATIDGIFFYISGLSINNILFAGYIQRHNVQYGMLSLILEGGFRAGGFNSDPAHIGFLAPIIVLYGLYCKKYLITLLGLASLLMAQSTTGILCSIVMIIIDASLISKRSNKAKAKNFVRTIIFIILAIIVVLAVGSKFSTHISSIISKFASRIKYVYSGQEGSMSLAIEPRVYHLIRILPAIANAGGLILFGTGFGTMSYAYTMGKNNLVFLSQYQGKAYDIDMTYLSYLFDTGIVGLTLYCIILCILFKFYRKRVNNLFDGSAQKMDVVIYYSVFSMIITHFTYHYILFSTQIILLVVALNRICWMQISRENLYDGYE